MAQGEGEKEISKNRRKAIFRALVDAQDHKLGVSESRKLIAKRFGLTEGQIHGIEQEGLDRRPRYERNWNLPFYAKGNTTFVCHRSRNG